MKNTFLLLVLAVLSLSLIKPKDIRIVKKHYDSAHNVYVEQQYIQADTGMVADGFYKEYYKSGKLKMLAYSKKGLKDSIAYQYYENGKVSKKCYYVMNEQVGSAYQYEKDGAIQIYSFTPPANREPTFSIKYDFGKIVEVRGKPVFISASDEKDIYDPSDSVKLIVSYAVPEKTKAKFFISLYKDDFYKKFDVSADVKKVQLFNSHIYLTDWICKDGNVRYTGIVKLYDNTGGRLIWEDSVSYNIQVK